MLYKSIITAFALVATLASTGASPLPITETAELAARDTEDKRFLGDLLCGLGLVNVGGLW
jgi:hypothetical protein